MKKTLCLVIAVVVLGVCGLARAAEQSPVVVELFTSEGCSSCPPADAALLELSRQPTQNGAPLILLGEHVDYWNYIGWTDRFSSKQFSERQSDYARAFHLGSVYTPQMVIDGQVQFVGNDAPEVRRKIDEAARDAKPAQVSLAWAGKGRLQITVQSQAAMRGKVLLAVTEDGLSTAVGSGENGGHTLHHAAVVRQLRDVGKLDNGKFAKTVSVDAPSGWNVSQLKVAVLVQDAASEKIVGAAQVAYQQ